MRTICLIACWLFLVTPSSAAVEFRSETITDSELEFTVRWDENFPGFNGIVADIFTRPWLFFMAPGRGCLGDIGERGSLQFRN